MTPAAVEALADGPRNPIKFADWMVAVSKALRSQAEEIEWLKDGLSDEVRNSVKWFREAQALKARVRELESGSTGNARYYDPCGKLIDAHAPRWNALFVHVADYEALRAENEGLRRSMAERENSQALDDRQQAHGDP